jgi:hypothetical protein
MVEFSATVAPVDRDHQPTDDERSEHALVHVTVSYVRALEPVRRDFAPPTTLLAVKLWAVSAFHLATNPAQPWVLIDAHTDQAITPAEEAQSLAERGYHDEAQFRLSVEHLTGC